MKCRAITCLISSLASGALHAQAVAPGVRPEYQEMMKAIGAAQAEANQPGDEKLTCEELEQQVVAVAQDPAFQAQVKAGGAAAEQEMAAIQAAEGEIAAKSVATAIASTVPGASMGHMMANAAENQAKAAQGAAHVQARMLMGQELMTLMPKILRGERLLQLAAARKCKFASSLNTGISAEAATPAKYSDP
jgi:hypothetical protein